MAYTVFLSHSMVFDDAQIVTLLVDQLALFKVDCYVAERDWKFGHSLGAKLEQRIKDCDCLLALITRGSAGSPYVNQEMGVAIGQGKLVVPIVEQGVDLKGFKQGVEWIQFDRENPTETVTRVTAYMAELARKKSVNQAVGWGIIAVLGYLASRGG